VILRAKGQQALWEVKAVVAAEGSAKPHIKAGKEYPHIRYPNDIASIDRQARERRRQMLRRRLSQHLQKPAVARNLLRKVG
jgi:hypothetical protein